jgi:type IV pilus assembly protein PilW
MKVKVSYKSLQTQNYSRGFTLIELMVSLVIGLLLSIAGSAAYLFSKQAYNAVSETSQMEENGRFALNLLGRYVQSAGFVMYDPAAITITTPSIDKIRGCDFGFVDALHASAPAQVACRTSAPSGERQSSSLVIFSETDNYDITNEKFQGFNCVGEKADEVTASSGTIKYRTRSYFFISPETVSKGTGTTTMGQLSCVSEKQTTGTYSYQPLIPGIEQLGIRYLVPAVKTVSGETPQLAQKSLSAKEITDADRWGEVMAAELCVLTKSIQAAGNDTGTQYSDCFGNTIAANPSESFRTFRSVVNLRNRSPAP